MSQRDSNGRVGSDDTAYAAGTVGTVVHRDHVSSCSGEDGDPPPWQCSASSCPAIVGSSHLSATYGRWLAPMARAVLEDHAPPDGA